MPDLQLQRQDIVSLLSQLGQELIKKKFRSPVKILLIGGAYMILELQNRQTTQDIDIYPLNFPDSMQPDKQTKDFQAAIRAVARQYSNMPKNWLNDVAFSLRMGSQPEESELELYASYGMLEIYRPPRPFILALKLFADRPKDRPDIAALLDDLQIRTRAQAQAILDRYYDRITQMEYRVNKTLDRLFP